MSLTLLTLPKDVLIRIIYPYIETPAECNTVDHIVEACTMNSVYYFTMGKFLSSTCKYLRSVFLPPVGYSNVMVMENLYLCKYEGENVFDFIIRHADWKWISLFMNDTGFIHTLINVILHTRGCENSMLLLNQLCAEGYVDVNDIDDSTHVESVAIIAKHVNAVSKKLFIRVVNLGLGIFNVFMSNLKHDKEQLASAHSWVVITEDNPQFHKTLIKCGVEVKLLDYDVAVRVCAEQSALWMGKHLHGRNITPNFVTTIGSTIDYEQIPTMVKLSQIFEISTHDLIRLVFEHRGLEFIYRFIEYLSENNLYQFGDRELLSLIAKYKGYTAFDEVIVDLNIKVTPKERLSILAETKSTAVMLDYLFDESIDYSPRPNNTDDLKSIIAGNYKINNLDLNLHSCDVSYDYGYLMAIEEETPGTFSRTPSPCQHNFY
ncbi:hypothetical protein E24_00184 [Faustovirus]|nr:hypothetical protein PRJ_Fausto_00170 [Faustovirus]AMN83115.1 hypothetical protein E24_00184 [Faustovirus]AMN85084.1 hypothetical protein E23_00183 [Faustovirus]QBR99083.1 hypothetical protein [Faustovirus mariensis]